MWRGSHERAFEDIILAVDLHGTVSLIGGPNIWELDKCLGDMSVHEYFGFDDDGNEDRIGFPEKAGIYRCTVDFWYEQGYFEGYACDSESDWGISVRDVKRIEVPEDNRFPWYTVPRA